MPNRGHGTAPTRAWRDRTGFCGVEPLDQPAGSLDLGQREHLRALAGRIKLTHDLLAVFADWYAAFPLELMAAQTRELMAVRALLERYGITDPNAGLPEGAFNVAESRRDYQRLRGQGAMGRAVAFDVIATTLRETTAFLECALPRLAAPDVRSVYLQVAASTLRQLRVVQAWSGR